MATVDVDLAVTPSSRLRLDRSILQRLDTAVGKPVLLHIVAAAGTGTTAGDTPGATPTWAAAAVWPTKTDNESAARSSVSKQSSHGSLPETLILPADALATRARVAAFAVPAHRDAASVTLTIEGIRRRDAPHDAVTWKPSNLDPTTRQLLAVVAKELVLDLGFLVAAQRLAVPVQSVLVLLRAHFPDSLHRPATLEDARSSVRAVSRATQVRISTVPAKVATARSAAHAAAPLPGNQGSQPTRPTRRLGGLDRELAQLDELVKLPLLRPELFQEHGLQPPRGVLLHGPPGTGKTSLALSVATSFLPPESIFTISGPELSSSYHGRTEARIRKVFSRARRCETSVVIIDEIDVIAGNREGDDSDAVGSRVVATLLTEIDGVGQEYRKRKAGRRGSRRVRDGSDSGSGSDEGGESDADVGDDDDDNDDDNGGDGVNRHAGPSSARPKQPNRMIVIAATNRPNVLDPALRRPGRLDREIEIGVPNPEARLDIFQTLLRNTPHNLTTEQLQAVAKRTHGFVGADLSALVREAGMRVIRRRLALEKQDAERSSGQAGIDGIVSQAQKSLTLDSGDAVATRGTGASEDPRPIPLLGVEDLFECLPLMRPSSLRSVASPPPLSWSSIGLGSPTSPYAMIKQAIQQTVEWPLKYGDRMRKLGISGSRGVLLYGPPGCSKTMIARACAESQGVNWIGVKGPELYSKFLGDTERQLRDLFRKARSASPTIIFFDEIDALTTSRSLGGEGGGGGGGGGGPSDVSDRVIATLLTELDSFDPLDKVVVVAATNRPMVIDPALLRPGRLETCLYVGPPDHSARLDILQLRVANMSVPSSLDLAKIADLSQGCSGAEVVALCNDAGRRAMLEDVQGCEVVEQRHFEEAAKHVTRGITTEMLARYQQWSLTRGAGVGVGGLPAPLEQASNTSGGPLSAAGPFRWTKSGSEEPATGF
ncbi:unnamed protein product [Parajaminaea phylloscopi]